MGQKIRYRREVPKYSELSLKRLNIVKVYKIPANPERKLAGTLETRSRAKDQGLGSISWRLFS